MATIGYLSGAIDASSCIGDAWELVKQRLGLYVGSSLLMFVILIVVGVIPFAEFLVSGPLMGGFAYLVLRDLRGEPVEFSMLFHGFNKYLKLVLIGLVQAFPAIIYQIVQLGLAVRDLLNSTGTADPNFFQSASSAEPFGTGLNVAFVLMIIGYFIFSIIWNMALIFAIPLFVEHDLPVLNTIKLSLAAVFNNLGGLIVLGILGTLVAILGMFALCIGLFVAIPVVYVANVIAYKQVFPLPGETFFSRKSGSILNLDSDA